MNQIMILGNLGQDPELRYTPQGTAVASFSMATNERKKNRDTGDNEDLVTWFRITVFGKQAESAAQYLAKGRQALVLGRLHQESFTDRDGNARTSLEVIANTIQFVGGPQASNEADNAEAPATKTDTKTDTKTGTKTGTKAAPKGAAKSKAGDDAKSDDDVPF